MAAEVRQRLPPVLTLQTPGDAVLGCPQEAHQEPYDEALPESPLPGNFPVLSPEPVQPVLLSPARSVSSAGPAWMSPGLPPAGCARNWFRASDVSVYRLAEWSEPSRVLPCGYWPHPVESCVLLHHIPAVSSRVRENDRSMAMPSRTRSPGSYVPYTSDTQSRCCVTRSRCLSIPDKVAGSLDSCDQ